MALRKSHWRCSWNFKSHTTSKLRTKNGGAKYGWPWGSCFWYLAPQYTVLKEISEESKRYRFTESR
jgi:hypothetical protein